jgi:hypothetical protein
VETFLIVFVLLAIIPTYITINRFLNRIDIATKVGKEKLCKSNYDKLLLKRYRYNVYFNRAISPYLGNEIPVDSPIVHSTNMFNGIQDVLRVIGIKQKEERILCTLYTWSDTERSNLMTVISDYNQNKKDSSEVNRHRTE